MAKWLKTILPIAAAAGANYLLPGSGQAAGALVGGIMGGKSKQKQAKQSFADVLRAARPDQANAYGDTLKWTTGPDGRPVQTVAFSPEKQARLEAFNKMAGNRMNLAAAMDPTGKDRYADYEKMGLGALLGGEKGTTGERPWAKDKYSSMGGEAFKNLTYSGPSPNSPVAANMQQTWANPQPPGSLSGGPPGNFSPAPQMDTRQQVPPGGPPPGGFPNAPPMRLTSMGGGMPPPPPSAGGMILKPPVGYGG